MKKLTGLLATGIILLGGANYCLGQSTLTETFSYSSTPTDWTASLSVAKFNVAGATLTDVILSFSASMTTSLTVTNSSSSASSVTAVYTQEFIGVTNPDSLFHVPLDFGTSQLVYYSTTNTASLPGHGTTIINPPQANSSTYIDNVSANYSPSVAQQILGEFTGSGNITLTGASDTYTGINYTGGNASAIQATQAGLNGSVEYVYTPTPEPATAGLLVLGLVCVPFLRRQRQ